MRDGRRRPIKNVSPGAAAFHGFFCVLVPEYCETVSKLVSDSVTRSARRVRKTPKTLRYACVRLHARTHDSPGYNTVTRRLNVLGAGTIFCESCVEGEKKISRNPLLITRPMRGFPRTNIRVGLCVKSQIALQKKKKTISNRSAISKASFYDTKMAYNKIMFVKRVLRCR